MQAQWPHFLTSSLPHQESENDRFKASLQQPSFARIATAWMRQTLDWVVSSHRRLGRLRLVAIQGGHPCLQLSREKYLHQAAQGFHLAFR